MGSVSISTGRVSTVNGSAASTSKGHRGRKDKKFVDIEAHVTESALRIIGLLEDPKGSYNGKLTCEGKGAFKRWVLKNMPACGAKPQQRQLIAQRVVGMLLEGGEKLRRVRHSTGGRHDFYEVTTMGRVFLRDPEKYEMLCRDESQRARAMHPSTGVVRTLGKKSEAAA